MFSSKQQLIKKTGPTGIGRYEYLKQLINEFNTTNSSDCKYQTLANLSNFAYDPINFEFLKQLHCLDVFLAQLSENDVNLIHFALAGICNIVPDPECKDYIVKLNGIKLISQFLLHENDNIALNSLTALYYISLDDHKHLVTSEIVQKAQKYTTSSDSRFRNLGTIFLENVQ